MYEIEHLAREIDDYVKATKFEFGSWNYKLARWLLQNFERKSLVEKGFELGENYRASPE